MPGSALLERRPTSRHSGSPLKGQCKIQHRSDILMKEQVQNVQASQDMLKAAEVILHAAKPSDADRYQTIVNDLEIKVERQLIVLQIMHKLDTELAYARADLQTALYEQVGDINTARKRVKWLEDKMGDLCGKKRLKSQPVTKDDKSTNKTEITSHEQRDLAVESSSQVDQEKSTVEAESGDVETSSNAENPTRDSKIISDETEVSNETEEHKTPVTAETNDKEVSNLSKKVTIFVTTPDEDEQADEDDEEMVKLEEEQKETDLPGGSSLDYDQSSSSKEKKKSVVQIVTGDDVEQPTFLTEVSKVTSKSGVTTASTVDNKGYVCDVEEDAVRDYWESEHHRFDLGQYYNELIDNDPISYHNLGVSLPGCFIDNDTDDQDFNELPWRLRRKESDIKDVHRIALDKLALKLNGMYTKVYDAAMLSVLPSARQGEGQPQESRFQSREVVSQGHLTDTSDNARSQRSGKKSDDTFALPKVVLKKRGDNATKLVYYPKPIPPPDVLPITRTSKNKEFPRYSSAFAEPGADIRPPANRIVDQRNLMEETKLVLYREKPKPKKEGPSTTERRFRRMLERDRTLSSVSSPEFFEVEEEAVSLRKKLRQSFIMAKSLAKIQEDKTDQEIAAVSSWKSIKPTRKGKGYSGLRWERVKSIVHVNLLSPRPEERRDAAKQLGLLRCGDTMVFYALKERLHRDEDMRVQYEAAKSLILIGCWDNEVLQVVLKFLVTGNTEIRLDLITTMTKGKNVQYVDKSISAFTELVKVLSHFCCNPDPDDPISIEAAVLIGKLCVSDINAKTKLSTALSETDDSHLKAKALEILVKQLNCTDETVVRNLKDLLQTSPVSKHRALATKLLITLGPKHPCIVSDAEDIYNLLERKLWDEPSLEVRVSSGKALTALGMFSRACESVEKRLDDCDEETRAEAVVSVGTLGMKSEKLTRLLLEMLELDTSEYVRIMIIRAFAILTLTDKRVMRCLKERERLDGPLGVESRKAIKILEAARESTPKLQSSKANCSRSVQLAVK
ncbi:hypothetical protein SNE40_005199 [Patella caerulea]|uniref:Uncharacterized protein n=1 Tax=Patella caerulea TaxID=87958 RepID=A0AAN8K2F9_PATCE